MYVRYPQYVCTQYSYSNLKLARLDLGIYINLVRKTMRSCDLIT